MIISISLFVKKNLNIANVILLSHFTPYKLDNSQRLSYAHVQHIYIYVCNLKDITTCEYICIFQKSSTMP